MAGNSKRKLIVPEEKPNKDKSSVGGKIVTPRDAKGHYLKGHSGNPGGAPKGKGFRQVLRDLAEELMRGTDADGNPVEMPRQEAFARWLFHLASTTKPDPKLLGLHAKAIDKVLERIDPVEKGETGAAPIVIQVNTGPARAFREAYAEAGGGNGRKLPPGEVLNILRRIPIEGV